MPASIVLELQRDALDRHVRVSDLLRKALVVARKLGLSDFEAWIAAELNGYAKSKDVPAYRMLYGQVRAWNPLRGWQPVLFPNDKVAQAYTERGCSQSVAELEAQIERTHAADSRSKLGIPFPAEIAAGMLEGGFQTEVILEVQVSALSGILDAVRTTVLNWALKLEEDGILGEGLSFSAGEKQRAQQASTNVNNFFGPVTTAQIAQQSDHAVQVALTLPDKDALQTFATEVRRAMPAMKLDDNSRQELEADLDTLDAQLKSPKPKWAIARQAFKSIRTVLEGMAGNVAAELLKHYVGGM